MSGHAGKAAAVNARDDSHTAAAGKPNAAALAAAAAIRRAVDEVTGPEASFAEREAANLKVTNEVVGVTMQVTRATYRLVGEHNGPTVVPLDLQAGIIEGSTPALAFAVASGCADGTDRACAEQLRAAHRRSPSRSTIQRTVQAIGGKTKTEAPRIEAVVRQEERLHREAHAVSVGLDRTSVPMEEPRPAGAPVPTGRRKRTKPYLGPYPTGST